jgi:hypothetical protein
VIAPTTVWMVHLDGREHAEVEGTLAEDDGGFVFSDPSSGSETRFAFDDLVKVKRVMGSPVFILRWRRGAERRETAFYLTRPPPLGTLSGPDRPGATLQTAALRGGKWRQRRTNTRYLAATSTSVRDSRDAWVDRIRAVVKERGEG